MKCETCGRSLTPFAPSRDCGRHPAPRAPRIIVPTTSPWVRRALTATLPASDRTGRIIGK